MGLNQKFIWSFLFVSLLLLKSIDGDGIRLPDQISHKNTIGDINSISHIQQSHNQDSLKSNPSVSIESRRIGKDLFDLVGLGTGPDIDPYVARTNRNCLTGDLSECFKTHALNTFNDFFTRDSYRLTDNVRAVRMSEDHQRSLNQQAYEYSAEPRSSDSEWDQLIKFALRKVERFVKSVALEVHIPEEYTEGGRYSPRFIDGITDELDVIEDKKAPLFTRHKLKKLFIPLLLVLKIFKLKLLLFLPFILGLVSLKKLLGLAAIVLPGLFAYFKLCRPQQNYGNYYSSNGFPQYSPQGIGAASFHAHNNEQHFSNGNPFYRSEPTFAKPYSDYYSKSSILENTNNGIKFGESGHDLAYQGYSEYRSNTKKDAK